MLNPVVVITGASRGIGRATAQRLAADGAWIIACGRDREALEETAAAIAAAGGRCTIRTPDITSASEVQTLVDEVTALCGHIDVVINNAGQAPKATMDAFDVAAFDDLVATNIRAVFYLTRAVWPVMMQRRQGAVVTLSSMAAVDPFPGFQAYGATKAWVNAFTAAIAAEGRPHGIRAYAIGPGAVDTAMLRQHFPDFPSDQTLSPAAIADAIAWMLDPRAAAASGAVVYFKL